ncbi:acyl-CoA dehydrogenase family protein [Pseudonocardia oroxyli]|uniref:Acyl-CoA dehydrogenase n=1 Tax=Pseudonocardia oroxyli TaxID=366584 RepID=A0A1G7HPT1_PSEOR|nr:Acyl-CoA dehydrogenase [Pseudonocardia oroxyli]
MTDTMAKVPPLVPPPVELPERVAALRAEVRAFLAEELAADRWRPRADTWLSGWDERFSKELAARGWLGMTIPPEYGGHGRGALERYVVTEELLAAGAPVAAHWIADRQIGPSLLRFGTEEQRQAFLPGIARGEVYFGIGMSEPDSGSDLASVRSRAEPVDGGWELTGTKVWTSGAHRAHAFFALVRTSPKDETNRHAGLSQLIVELDSPGVTIRPIPLLTGAHHFNEVVFDKVFIPESRVLGEIGQGWHQVTSELAFERSGPERYLSTFPLLTALLREAHQVDEERLGGLVSRYWTLRRMSLAIAGALEAGQAPELAAAVVKDLGTRFENEVIDAARTLLPTAPDPGGTGYARLLAEAVLHAPGFTLRGGTNEVLRGITARGLGLR